ncbi:hypothetical protein Enr13x_30170 [Stieleria neptunia]|uniref:Uncharacterized protein n=1 Tax=Stieleria neptunia TaxID=2527979 RepID=A0A518HQN0_9BACT|nr:hypothetical protein [Stieleria neptunia]QDV43163.1 hypothetical protein Enr13x_30170 [Stieleria neptunia]
MSLGAMSWGTKSIGSLAVVLLVGVYTVAGPHLNDRFGWQLPGLNQQADADATALAPEPTPTPAPIPSSHGPSADDHQDAGDSNADLHYGLLREIRPNVFRSPEGLQYVPGSAEGHRLEHLRRHTQDMPSRPGKHGVFDGGMEGALVTIDDAYERAQANQRSTKQTDRDRTIYTVDMERRVGYVGGREGKRQNHPIARRVKLVLEDTIVITAYPL